MAREFEPGPGPSGPRGVGWRCRTLRLQALTQRNASEGVRTRLRAGDFHHDGIFARPADLGEPFDADDSRNRPGHRQSHLHLHRGWTLARAFAGPRAHGGAIAGALHASGAAGLDLLAGGADRDGVLRRRPWLFLARPDPGGRRSLPALQGHEGDPRTGGGRRGGRGDRSGLPSQGQLRQRHRPDPRARHRLFAG